MPCFRGIEVCIVGQADVQRFPEFPHPDASSVRLGTMGHGNVVEQTPPGTADPTHIQKRKPTISVYIPSQPGVQFWIRYTVNRSPPECGHLYFKMFINGRHITSWGINPRVSPSGYVVRAFYEPGQRRSDGKKGDDHRGGIEGRYFFFSKADGNSIAEDGGLVEFNVFRANAKKRRPATVERYRDQETYGIASPSSGIVEEANYYDWYLSDPRDSPYATFRFHYRTWDNLQTLNIIPPGVERAIIFAPHTVRAMTMSALETSKSTPAEPNPEEDTRAFSFGPDFPSGPSDTTKGGMSTSKLVRSTSLVFNTRVDPRPDSSASTKKLPQPAKTTRDASLGDRPLPDLPDFLGAEFEGPLQRPAPRSRTSSMSSAGAVSIATSLVEYADSPILEDETLEVSVAKKLAISEATVPSFIASRISNKGSDDSISLGKKREEKVQSWRRPITPEMFTFPGRKGRELSRDIKGYSSFSSSFGREPVTASGSGEQHQQSCSKARPAKKLRSNSENRHGAIGNILKNTGDFLGLSKMGKVGRLSEAEWIKKSGGASSPRRSPKHLQSKSINVPSIGAFGRGHNNGKDGDGGKGKRTTTGDSGVGVGVGGQKSLMKENQRPDHVHLATWLDMDSKMVIPGSGMVCGTAGTGNGVRVSTGGHGGGVSDDGEDEFF